MNSQLMIIYMEQSPLDDAARHLPIDWFHSTGVAAIPMGVYSAPFVESNGDAATELAFQCVDVIGGDGPRFRRTRSDAERNRVAAFARFRRYEFDFTRG